MKAKKLYFKECNLAGRKYHDCDEVWDELKVGTCLRILSVAFIKRHALESPSIVQTAIKKMTENDLITIQNGEYYLSDILLQLFLRKGE